MRRFSSIIDPDDHPVCGCAVVRSLSTHRCGLLLKGVQLHNPHLRAGYIDYSISTALIRNANLLNALTDRGHRFEVVRLSPTVALYLGKVL